jgi:hypothetical protein
MKRSDVFTMIEDRLASMDKTPTDMGFWFKDMRSALSDACVALSYGDEEVVSEVAKLAALCVMCLEQHGE